MNLIFLYHIKSLRAVISAENIIPLRIKLYAQCGNDILFIIANQYVIHSPNLRNYYIKPFIKKKADKLLKNH